MDAAIDLSDASKALDLSNIRFQLIRLEDTITFHLIERIFLPKACLKTGRSDRGEREENYGSAATCDINCLQALSRRIHFGKFVAESKFQAEKEAFTKMIQAGDREGLARAITNEKVELQVLERLKLKARTYGTDPSLNGNGASQAKINVEAVEALYRDFVIPLTKVVEVEYLMQRLTTKE
ncbi:hypothetical protein DID88_003140 [Monilinia fructigena]|uniref:Chorismate mutase n=1 Tax=Monilinia fructigena TaxID=38457 RepID=A0A395IUK9_9HELO|nr:hypothetical protein DID88_003140 [Monilinia fructigena]